MEKNKEDLLAMFIEAVNDSITNMDYDCTECGMEFYPKFRFTPNIVFTDDHIEAIRSMAIDGDDNAASLLGFIEDCYDRMDFEL